MQHIGSLVSYPLPAHTNVTHNPSTVSKMLPHEFVKVRIKKVFGFFITVRALI